MESPTDPHIENRPPIKSYILKIRSLLIPKFSTAFKLDDTAQKWLLISFVFKLFITHSFAILALVRVSWVVNVFETIMKNVVSGFSLFKISAVWSPSTLDIKWIFKWFL